MSECILWPAERAMTKQGYGARWHPETGKVQTVHRIAFFERHGYWPKVCRHTCDIKLCHNADHLVDGDHSDNLLDAYARGQRIPNYGRGGKRGSDHHGAKLNDEAVKCIRWLADHGRLRREIADAYNVSLQSIQRVATRKTWRHIPETPGSTWPGEPATKGSSNE